MTEEHPPTRAIILAAGRGRRLRPHTDHTPKPLLAVGGRPTLDYILSALARAAVIDVCLVTHHLAEQINDYVGDGAGWAMKATFRHQNEVLGAAHALQSAADFLTEPCFLVAADYLLPLDYLLDLKKVYQQDGTDLAVSLKQLPEEELDKRSSIRFDEKGRILEIVEKPAPGTAPSQVGASMIFIVPPQIRDYLIGMRRSHRGEYELQTVINQMLKDGYQITGYLQPAPPEWKVRLETR